MIYHRYIRLNHSLFYHWMSIYLIILTKGKVFILNFSNFYNCESDIAPPRDKVWMNGELVKELLFKMQKWLLPILTRAVSSMQNAFPMTVKLILTLLHAHQTLKTDTSNLAMLLQICCCTQNSCEKSWR